MIKSKFIFGLFAALFIGLAVADDEVEIGEIFFKTNVQSDINHNGWVKIKWWVNVPQVKEIELEDAASGFSAAPKETSAFLSINDAARADKITSNAQSQQFELYEKKLYLPTSFSGTYSDGGISEPYTVIIDRKNKTVHFTFKYNGKEYTGTSPTGATKFNTDIKVNYFPDKQSWVNARTEYCKKDSGCRMS